MWRQCRRGFCRFGCRKSSSQCSLEFFKKQLCKNWLGSCSDEHSWKKSRDLLEKVGRQGDLTGYRVSCLLIGAKDYLTPYPRAVQDSVKVK
ncbi:hypothetical protein GLYMA_19G169800v4 [Glycine max]|nr:hypothetical protein GLYMA_19G169800v4 [Glycine max]KAG4396372.1 hypothetical protein GLYMA_19G169800v4 [Glycine max]KAH1078242.1 hypothetical protein GYH30_053319 [Glycine max]KAH1078243.1 hypothetical protein GYH30_053319 [Glycine max]KAH1078244.1 hypothetical protein GYH30_053319 [Glycine max]